MKKYTEKAGSACLWLRGGDLGNGKNGVREKIHPVSPDPALLHREEEVCVTCEENGCGA